MIGKFLKQRRLAKGLTQDYVARYLTVSRQAVSNWENGTRDINLRDLISYAKLLEVSFEDLEDQINYFQNLPHPFPVTLENSILPKHFSLSLNKRGKERPSRKKIKIEGDKVVGVHLLLTSLFFDKQKLVLKNCPTALDFLNILYEFSSNEWMDVQVRKDTVSLKTDKIPYDITRLNKISRASIGIISALTYRNHKLLFNFPGGDDFCERPINLHLDILSNLAKIRQDFSSQAYYSERNDLLNKNLDLNCNAVGSRSVGAFFNAISLAYVYPNQLTINGISPDPTIFYLIKLLEQATNRQVHYISLDKITIPEVDAIEIVGSEMRLPPDMCMLVSYVLMLWDSLEETIFENVQKEDIPESYEHLFEKLGLSMIEENGALLFKKEKEIDRDYFDFVRLGAAPFISTDLGPILSEFLASQNISSILFDEVFIDRSSHLAELSKLGIGLKVLENGGLKTLARSELDKENLETFDLKDIRAGMAILMGIFQSDLSFPLRLERFDQVLRGFGNILEVLEMMGYEGDIDETY